MSIEAEVRITNPTGLHARPAVRLAQLASSFKANVQLRLGEDGDWVRAASTAKIMKLKARSNATLHFRADGDEASDAVAALVAFVERDFDEEPATIEVPSSAPREPYPGDASAGDRNGKPVAVGVETTIGAEVASQGLAAGVLFQCRNSEHAHPARANAEAHRVALEAAIDAAVAQLEKLKCDTDPMAAEIIGIQVELLRDQELVASAWEAIAAGRLAEAAWEQCLDPEIKDYEQADDGYFRARAADLRDLRQRVLANLSAESGGALETPPAGAILYAEELSPSQFLELDWALLGGAVTLGGSSNSHVAMLARARGVPFLTGLRCQEQDLRPGLYALLMGNKGDARLIIAPDPGSKDRFEKELHAQRAREQSARAFLPLPAQTRDGTRIKLYVNVDDPSSLDLVESEHCDGIGLTRSEFLFHGRQGLPDEETQYRHYGRLIAWAGGRPVTVRTLDAGGDKPIPGLTPKGEGNPFLGLRGVRLSLARPEVFNVQLRALARAAVLGPLKVMIPMVTVPEELARTRHLLEAAVTELTQRGIEAAMPSLGMMVEVPAAALNIEAFKSDFMSIGSNDLLQYLTAAGRDCPSVAELQDPLNPALLELIERVAREGERARIEVSLCGEMAATPECLPALLGAGIRTLSVPSAALGKVKAALARL